jgi:hypothetical protein
MSIHIMVDEIADTIMVKAKKMKKKELLDYLSEMVIDNLLNMNDEAIIDLHKEMKEYV